MDIVGGEVIRNETNTKAMGGTELIALKLASVADPELLKEIS